MKNKLKIVYMASLATITWFALALQFYISIDKYLTDGRTLGGAIIQLFTYYTIQNNLLVALSLTAILLAQASALGRFFAKPAVITSISVYITIVFLVYQLILRGQHTLVGLFRLTDELMHTFIPPAFVLFWLVFMPTGKIPWLKALTWLIYPLLYCFFILIRGYVSGYYPYSFIDGNKLNYQQIFINCVFLMFAFLGIGLLFIAIARLFKKAMVK